MKSKNKIKTKKWESKKRPQTRNVLTNRSFSLPRSVKKAMVMGGKNKKPSNHYAYQNANNHHSANMEDEDKECECCSLSCLKFSLHLFNAVFFLTGFDILAVVDKFYKLVEPIGSSFDQ